MPSRTIEQALLPVDTFLKVNNKIIERLITFMTSQALTPTYLIIEKKLPRR